MSQKNIAEKTGIFFYQFIYIFNIGMAGVERGKEGTGEYIRER